MKINISTLVFSCSQINDDYTMSWLKIVLVVLVMRVAIQPREKQRERERGREKERSFRVVHARLPLGHRKKMRVERERKAREKKEEEGISSRFCFSRPEERL